MDIEESRKRINKKKKEPEQGRLYRVPRESSDCNLKSQVVSSILQTKDEKKVNLGRIE